MIAPEQLQSMIGRNAVDTSGAKIGKIGQIYLDDASGAPQWVTISTGLFGTKQSFAPISGSRFDGDNLVLNVTKDEVKGAPNVDAGGHLDDAENHRLYAYYDGSFDAASEDRAGNNSASRHFGSEDAAASDVSPAAGGDETSARTPTAR